MPPRSPLDLLPGKVKQELNERLRSNGYKGLQPLAEWLATEHACKTSKTALGRYSLDLKSKDQAAAAVAKDLLGDLAGMEAIDLLVELGTLKVKEQRILRRLEEIGYI
jgi:hypothetical protein